MEEVIAHFHIQMIVQAPHEFILIISINEIWFLTFILTMTEIITEEE